MSGRAAPGREQGDAAADIHAARLLILDFGSQYTQLIARRVREIGVYCEIRPWRTPAEEIQAFAPRALILSGGPDTLTAGSPMRLPQEVLALDIPILGICYGMQLLATHGGGEVEAAGHREYGHARAQLTAPCPLFDGLGADRNPPSLEVWMSHGDRVKALPPDWEVCAVTDNAPIAAMQEPRRRRYGLQFHPEVTHTPAGAEILRRFVCEVAGLPPLWSAGKIIEDRLERVRAQVGQDKVLLALSGGVDSSVTAALLQRAVGAQLLCIFVDNGLLRQDEGDQVMRVLGEQLQVNVLRVDAGERFFAALRGVADPEHKRRIIGQTFIEVFEQEARRHGDIRWLAQGTIYPDVIESAAGGDAATIKSHHNVGGLPQRMKLQLVEPLRELFKDEVRAIGAELGLPQNVLQRHPFPGPGLGVRILGEVSEEAAETLRQADAIFMEELRRSGWHQKTAQAFAVHLPVRSVGVTGDARKYAPVIALRAVQTDDFMTAHHAPLPAELLAGIARRILNEVSDVSRVVYDISDKPPATIEWE